ncbi:MAG: dihydrofolate reductase family protein, partial [Gaiellaceae bacterium]
GVLAERGVSSVLSEGGPSLFADLVAADVLDEVCLTVVPQLLGGDHPRIATGADAAAELRLTTLLEEDGTLLGRWSVERPG